MQQGCKDRPLLPEGQGPMASWHSPYVCSHVHNNIFRQPCLCAPYLTFPQLKHQFGPWRSSWEYWGEDNHLQAKWWLHQNQVQLVFCLHGPKQPETNVLAYPTLRIRALKHCSRIAILLNSSGWMLDRLICSAYQKLWFCLYFGGKKYVCVYAKYVQCAYLYIHTILWCMVSRRIPDTAESQAGFAKLLKSVYLCKFFRPPLQVDQTMQSSILLPKNPPQKYHISLTLALLRFGLCSFHGPHGGCLKPLHVSTMPT